MNKEAAKNRSRENDRRIVVLDDDPTGTQTVSDVEVMLVPDQTAFRRFLASGEKALFVLTNTRALPTSQAVLFLRRIREAFDREAADAGCRLAYVLRGDSTLRGHVFPEMDVFSSANSVGLFVPAFPECGRLTIGGIQWLEDGRGRRPVSETEYAKDPVFGYQSRFLRDWVAEVSDGWRFVTVPLAYARQAGASAISQALRDAAPRTVVIPDAETEEDLERIAIGLMEAEAGGTSVVVRSASTFARIRCGLVSKRIATVALPERANILIVCGSHTEATTRQLERLMGRTAIRPVVVPTDELLMHGEETVVNQAVERLRAEWTSNRFALLASERTRRADHGDMETGAIVMKALTSIVGVLSGTLDAIIAKGGITSAETATVGMKAATANVCGQLQDGISLWKLSTGSGRIIPYAVIPGNVGEDDAILDVAKQFGLEMI